MAIIVLLYSFVTTLISDMYEINFGFRDSTFSYTNVYGMLTQENEG